MSESPTVPVLTIRGWKKTLVKFRWRICLGAYLFGMIVAFGGAVLNVGPLVLHGSLHVSSIIGVGIMLSGAVVFRYLSKAYLSQPYEARIHELNP